MIRSDARKRDLPDNAPIPLPAAPWRGPVEIYRGVSQLRNTTWLQYGEIRPQWPVPGWSSGERRLWLALAAIVDLLPLLEDVRERCDEYEVGCLASLLETIGAVMQPAAIGGKP